MRRRRKKNPSLSTTAIVGIVAAGVAATAAFFVGRSNGKQIQADVLHDMDPGTLAAWRAHAFSGHAYVMLPGSSVIANDRV